MWLQRSRAWSFVRLGGGLLRDFYNGVATFFDRVCVRVGIQPSSTKQSPRFFRWLDLLRGVAALAILFWHYSHFYISEKSDMPLYFLFWPLYEYGDMAVQLFWVLSGFVFAHVYSHTEVSSKEFFLARFARLYPLHFITLVVVAVEQYINLKVLGSFLIYEYNDLYHFILNVFFIPHWGFQMGRSFNAPVWSVSVELLIYVIFWLTLPFVKCARRVTPLLALGGMMALYFGGAPAASFWQCGMFFFIGASLYLWADTALVPARTMIVSALGLTGMGILSVLTHMPLIALQLSFLPALVAIIATLDLRGVKVFVATRLGDLSYGLYLWHIPVQLLLLACLQFFSIDMSVTRSIPFLVLFLSLVIGVAFISFHAIENPLRKWIRS